MINKIPNNNDTQDNHYGSKGENGINSGYEKLWDKLKEDLGIRNIILIFLGSILLIFSPEKGWEFDIPCIDYTIVYRGWLGILCFVIVLISIFINKKRSVLLKSENMVINTEQMSSKPETISSNITRPENEGTKSAIRSMYVHFSKDKYNNLFYMCSQLNICNDYESAMLLLLNFQKLFNGKVFFSPFIQVFAKEKLIATKGENDKEWCWWYWDGGDEGFQLIVSLCK